MSNTVSRHEIDMCSGPMAGKIFQFVLPLMLSSILQLLFNAADIIVVSQYCGDEALAAVGSTGSLVNIIVCLFTGLATATNIIAARQIGERNASALSNNVHTSILVSFIGGIIVSLIGLFLSEKMLMLMGSPAEVIVLSALYLKIYFLGSPAMLIYNFGSSLLRAKGDTKRPLYIITLGGIVNVILNFIMVAGFGRNVDGVAIATVVSQYMSAILIILCLINEEGPMRLEIKHLKIHKEEFLELLRIGLPAGFQGMVFSFSNVIIQSSINFLGPTTMAGHAAANNIQGFLYVAGNAFYQSNMTFTSQNMGANKWDRVKMSLKYNVAFEVIVCIILGSVSYVFADTLLKIYTKDPEVIAAGITIMKYNCLLVFMCGLMETIMGSLRGMGYTFMTTIVSVSGSCVVRVAWIFTIFKMFPTLDILLCIYPISWILTTLIHFICFLIVFPKRRKEAEALMNA